jgi:glucokinase
VRRAGVDIGGTKCLGVLVDDAGAVLREERLPTPSTGPDALLEVLDELAVALGPYDRFGVGAAGLVSTGGIWRAAPNVGGVWDFPIADRLGARLGHPVLVENDATCATLAEWQAGAALGASDVVLVTLGTGIGGGIVSGGRLVRGAHGFAGEPGHMVVDPNGPPCVCGRRGCWERYASGSGLARLAREAATGGRLARVVTLAGDAEAVRGEHVQSAAREGDHDALVVIDQWAWWVALGLVNLTNLLDPEVVVMGGGLAAAVDLVLAPVRRHFADLLYAPGHRAHPRIEMAALGEQAGAIGAALLDYSL